MALTETEILEASLSNHVLRIIGWPGNCVCFYIAEKGMPTDYISNPCQLSLPLKILERYARR